MRTRNFKRLTHFLPLLVIAFSVIILVSQAPSAQAWAWKTHRFIVDEAKDIFTDGSFFSDHLITLREWCIKPDQGWGESDWHWLDAISYHPLETTGGKLPWAVENVFDNIIQNLKDENWEKAAELMGAIGHFTADATMPLHATYDYNPGGNHVSYEMGVDGRLDEISIPEYVPRELDNIFNAAMAVLEESFNFTDEDPEGGINLSDFLENDILWNDTIKSITENRLQAGVQFTANVWYTVMIRAGLTIQAPTLTSPLDGSTTTDNTPTFTWTPVDGTSFHDFQLASDSDFTTDVLTVKDLPTTSYISADPLADGEWYWRVRAGDNSTHVGLWSQTQQFTIGTGSTSPEETPAYVYLTCTSPDPAHTIKVSWRTDENYVGEVHYDTETGNGAPEAYSYSAGGTGGVTTARFEGYIHHVELTGLEPDTIYFFICGNPDHGWSEELSFKTAPVQREHIRFVQGGDSRSEQREGYYQYPWPDFRDKISKLMASYNPDFVLFTGDWLWSSQDQTGGDTWDNWFGAMFKYWRTSDNRLIPIIPVIGNHEVVYPEPSVYDPMTQAQNYYMIFDLPVEENRYAWYSLNWGPDLHIIVLDSEIRYRESDPWNEQVEWLGKDLLEHRDDLVKIAADHRPPLEDHNLRKDWSMEFDICHLDIMFSGHVHCYKRSHPLNFLYPENKQITEPENGTIYVVSPGWGEQPETAYQQWYAAVEPIPERHFVLADLYENGTLYLRAINIDNEIIDNFTIQKSVPSDQADQGEGMPLLLILGSGVLVAFFVALLVYHFRSS